MLNCRIVVVHGLLVPHGKAAKINTSLQSIKNVYSPFELFKLSYCKENVLGIESDLPFNISSQNFLEVTQLQNIPNDIYLKLCLLATFYGFKETDIKTYIYSEFYDPDFGIMDSW